MSVPTIHDVRSLAWHRNIATQVKHDGHLLTEARERLQRWKASGRVDPMMATAWAVWLDGPVDRLCAMLVDPDEHASLLRLYSPFVRRAACPTPEDAWHQVAESA